MQVEKNSLIDNAYICNTEDTIFTVLLRHSLIDNFDQFPTLNNLSAVHGLLQYPQWHADSDIFQYIVPEELSKIQNKKSFFIFDSSTEGYSPFKKPFFDMLYFNCKKYNIDPSMIIYVSSNLQDEKNISKYCKKRNLKPINVFSFVSFERVLAVDDKKINEELELQYSKCVNGCKNKFVDKYFSSLSRLNRHYRSIGTFMLFTSPLRDKALISHNKLKEKDVSGWLSYPNLQEYTPKNLKRWLKSLPLTIDQKDFNKNWALQTPYRSIHEQTLFQIVNETEVDNYKETALFYSEKTFRPIAHFQPFVIYGQQGCNHYLENIGYKLYNDWFDLSFDYEEDNILRYKKLLASVSEISKILDGMTRDQKIEWRFKNNEILKHNFKTMIESNYSKSKLLKFLKKLESTYEAN